MIFFFREYSNLTDSVAELSNRSRQCVCPSSQTCAFGIGFPFHVKASSSIRFHGNLLEKDLFICFSFHFCSLLISFPFPLFPISLSLFIFTFSFFFIYFTTKKNYLFVCIFFFFFGRLFTSFWLSSITLDVNILSRI